MVGKPQYPLETIVAVLSLFEQSRRERTGLSLPEICKAFDVNVSTAEHWRLNGIEYYAKRLAAKDSLAKASGAAKSSPVFDLPSPKNEGVFLAEKKAENIVLVIPDLHCPWEHQDALDFLLAVKEKYQPNIVVNLGDEVDFYGMSRFEHDPDVINAGAEINLAIKHLIPFYTAFPNVLVCESNHTHRVHAKAKKSGMPASSLKSIEEILKTPEGWIYKYCHTIDGVDYKHGTGKSGANAHINHAKATGRSTCIGHIHAHAGVNYLRYGLFAANFACLIDNSAPCFDYAREMDDNIVLGCGIVIGGREAYFIPMHLDSQRRWTGKL